ncbi:MAG TPA: ribonuclease HII, partial [Clostridiales bacterium]|nr:ribonuclease HII [Clostridiales bacterium]
LDYSIAIVSEKEIDEINILNAAMLAMRKAVAGLKIKPDFVLIDGNRLPETGYPERYIVKGDSLSMSIAAASILAKVSRDRYMLSLDEQYPEYCFNKHKGYGTALHYQMLEKYGISPVHRRSFLKNLAKHNG